MLTSHVSPGSSLPRAPVHVTANAPRGIAGGVQLLTEAPRNRVPIAGTIYPGAKVLTKKNAAVAAYSEIYRKGIEEGKSFSVIERELEQAGAGRNPLRMLNLPYFRVREADFRDPANARKLLTMYGKEKATGAGQKLRLRRFPIMFPVDDEEVILPHSLTAYAANTIRFFSRNRDGARHCMTLAARPNFGRTFGGRQEVVNPERSTCDPEQCRVYADGDCNLTGHFQFYVPGIAGAGMLRVPTRSFYSIDEALTQLRIVRALRGSVAGLIEGRPIFYLSKELREVSWLSPEGPKRVEQYLIVLTADVEMVQLAVERQRSERAALVAAASPVVEAPAPLPELAVAMTLANELGVAAEEMEILGGSPRWTSDPGLIASCVQQLERAKAHPKDLDALRERLAIMIEGRQP